MTKTYACPHCKVPYPERGWHVCADREPWTQAERDQWREDARRRDPRIHFTANSAELARRLGAYSQRNA